MHNTEPLIAVWAVGVLVVAAGGSLGSVVIASTGLLSVALTTAAVFALWTSNLLDGARSRMRLPDHIRR